LCDEEQGIRFLSIDHADRFVVEVCTEVLGVGVIYPVLFMGSINLSFFEFHMARCRGVGFARKMAGN
jgi:hypothetical protein